MKTSSVQRPPTSGQRRSIAVVTLTFVAVSAALHFTLGGIIRRPWVHEPVPQQTQLVIIDRLTTPPPTPKPTPRPTPRVTARPIRTLATQPHQAQKARPTLFAPIRVHPPTIRGPVSGAQPETSALPKVSVSPMPEESPTPLDASDIIISARFIKRVEPEYPQIALDQAIEGTVIVLVTIGPDGSASDIRVWQSSGNAALDRAALLAARESTYAPPEVDGQPATQTYRIIYTFYLD